HRGRDPWPSRGTQARARIRGGVRGASRRLSGVGGAAAPGTRRAPRREARKTGGEGDLSGDPRGVAAALTDGGASFSSAAVGQAFDEAFNEQAGARKKGNDGGDFGAVSEVRLGDAALRGARLRHDAVHGAAVPAALARLGAQPDGGDGVPELPRPE